MFQFHTVDQKIAFVMGLSLLLKIPFDVWQLFSMRSSLTADFASDWLPLFAQAVVCLLCLNHFGLLKAAMITINNALRDKKEL